jgi:hypothetical protein
LVVSQVVVPCEEGGKKGREGGREGLRTALPRKKGEKEGGREGGKEEERIKTYLLMTQIKANMAFCTALTLLKYKSWIKSCSISCNSEIAKALPRMRRGVERAPVYQE